MCRSSGGCGRGGSGDGDGHVRELQGGGGTAAKGGRLPLRPVRAARNALEQPFIKKRAHLLRDPGWRMNGQRAPQGGGGRLGQGLGRLGHGAASGQETDA